MGNILLSLYPSRSLLTHLLVEVIQRWLVFSKLLQEALWQVADPQFIPGGGREAMMKNSSVSQYVLHSYGASARKR